MRTRPPYLSVGREPCIRVLSRATATVWVGVALLALLVACVAALDVGAGLGGLVGVVAVTTVVVSLLLVGCLLLSLVAQTVAHGGFWLRSALRDAWNSRTPPHSLATGRHREPVAPTEVDVERAESYRHAVAYLYRTLASSLLLFVCWLVVAAVDPAWFELVGNSWVVRGAISVATFFVGVPLSAFPDVVVSTGTGQTLGADVVALVFGVLVLPSLPGTVAMANAVHYLACVHYDAYEWAYGVATGDHQGRREDGSWTMHASVTALTFLCIVAPVLGTLVAAQ